MLDEIARRRVFASVTSPERLASLYVSSDQLAGLRGDERPEAQLMRALASKPQPQRVHVIGPSGAGKTSMILKVLGDLASRTTEHEILIVNVGDDPARLDTPAAFMRTVVQLVQLQGYRFTNVDQDALRNAAADERTRTGRQVEHRAGLNAPVVSYTAGLKEAYETAKFGDNPARAREDFEDVLLLVGKDHRPVIVIDDTEHFVTAQAGSVEVDSVHNLYNNAIRSLAEIESVDLVVAMNPRYEQVDVVSEVARRFAFSTVTVPALPADSDEPRLAAILQRRLDRHEIAVRVAEVVDGQALAQIEAVYFANEHDLRDVLDLAADAATSAVRDGALRISSRHVKSLLDARMGQIKRP